MEEKAREEMEKAERASARLGESDHDFSRKPPQKESFLGKLFRGITAAFKGLFAKTDSGGPKASGQGSGGDVSLKGLDKALEQSTKGSVKPEESSRLRASAKPSKQEVRSKGIEDTITKSLDRGAMKGPSAKRSTGMRLNR